MKDNKFREQFSKKILLLVLLGIILVIFSFTQPSLKQNSVSSPSPSPSLSPQLTWITYTNQNLGVSFDYPKEGSIMENKEKMYEGTLVNVENSVFITVPVICNFEDQAYFIIEVSDTPPDKQLLSYLTTPQIIGGREGKKSAGGIPLNLQTDGRFSRDALVEYKNKYYLIKDETCSSDVGKQILKSIHFL